MGITVTQGIGIIILFILCATASFFFGIETNKSTRNILIGLAISILLAAGFIAFCRWYNSSTASGIRNYKDFKSEWRNGMYRELTITAEDGREIFRYEGKCDIEINKDNDNRYLRFESEDGKRYTIMYGVQDTVTIIEKDAPSEKGD